MDLIFRLSNLLVFPFWALMILLPRWRWTARIMRSPLVSIAPAALYAVLVVPHLSQIWPAVSRPTMMGIIALLGTPAGVTIAWAHFLCFDLFVGRWIYLDSQEKEVSPWLTMPVLFLTLMLGPIGFLLYLIVRALFRSRASDTGNLNPSVPLSASKTSAAQTLIQMLRRAWAINRPLAFLGVAMIIALLATLAGLLLDQRVVTGAPVWLKPAKFALSTSVYSFTFVWLLSFIKGHQRLVRVVANITAISLIVEMIVIFIQAARGTSSHFNMTTTLNMFLWNTMGAFIVFVMAMNLVVAVMLFRQPVTDRAFAWSLRLGTLVCFVGMAVAFFMVTPNARQLAALSSGQGPRIVGAHSVGVPDGGPGLPVTGWSTVGGDLRAAHFVGLHALQILPLFGWLIAQRRSRLTWLTDTHRLALVWTAGLAYLGVVLLLAWQALRGQSIVHPDPLTVEAAAALAALTSFSFLAIVGLARRQKDKGPVDVEDRPPARAVGMPR